jgi:hypothetical protein
MVMQSRRSPSLPASHLTNAICNRGSRINIFNHRAGGQLHLGVSVSKDVGPEGRKTDIPDRHPIDQKSTSEE